MFLNGKPITGTARVALHHNDRLFVGTNHVFRVTVPSERPIAEDPTATSKIDFLFAFNEKNQAEIAAVKEMEAARRAALEEEVRMNLVTLS